MNETKGGTAQCDSVTLVGYFEIKLEDSMTSLDKKISAVSERKPDNRRTQMRSWSTGGSTTEGMK